MNTNIKTGLRCSGYITYLTSKFALIHFVCLYALSLLIAYGIRQTDVVRIYKTSLWIAPFVFVMAYTYMQTDRMGSKYLVPRKLYLLLRLLVFAIMLTTISKIAFMCVLLSLLALLIFVSTFMSNAGSLKALSIIFLPTIFTYTIYSSLMIFYGVESAFDYIAGFFIQLSIAGKMSILALAERTSKLVYMPDAVSDAKFMEGEGEELKEDVEQIKRKFEKTSRVDDIVYGIQFGHALFTSNASSIFKDFIKVNIG